MVLLIDLSVGHQINHEGADKPAMVFKINSIPEHYSYYNETKTGVAQCRQFVKPWSGLFFICCMGKILAATA